MAVTTPPTISALPTPPSTSDPATFDTRADAFTAALPTHTTETNAASANVYANAVDAASSASASASSAASAEASAITASGAAGAPLWVSGTTYAKGDPVISPVNVLLYRRLIAGAGTTDPSLDTTNWVKAGGGLTIAPVSGTTQSAVAGNNYVLNNVAATAVTMPVTLVSGDMVTISPNNGLLTNTVDFGAKTVRFGANTVTGVLTLDLGAAIELVAVDTLTWMLL